MAGRKIIVETPARIHFGIINPFKLDTRRFISTGVGVDTPRNRIVVYPEMKHDISGCRSSEVSEKLKPIIEEYGLENGYVVIEECIPKHTGLGSTTQLLLGVALGLLVANGKREDLITIARKLGLGRVSGVGTYVFIHGGFIVDTGVKNNSYPNLFFHADFPEEWRFIVIVPSGRGLSDKEEERVFSTPIEVDASLSWKASHTLFTKMIPSLLERDFEEFSHALRELQEYVGGMFSSVQGGVFAESSCRYIELLKQLGVVGVGQSSWGPTVYGLVENELKAQILLERIKSLIDNSVRVFIARPQNRGARLYIEN